MKGFIEVSAHNREFIIAVSAILGIADQGKDKGCIISLIGPVYGLTGNGNSASLQQPYSIVRQQIEEQAAN